MKQKSYADIVADLKAIDDKLRESRLKQKDLITQLNRLSSKSKRLTRRAKKLTDILKQKSTTI